jgi:hypothetical protein
MDGGCTCWKLGHQTLEKCSEFCNEVIHGSEFYSERLYFANDGQL